jgi:diguanylate cyclase (GGDEF)-like protein/PAS domain S-box-containing protein
MNIEQKNTLFVVALILVVLGAVATMAYFLINRQVNEAIVSELTSAHAVFVETQKQSFTDLRERARHLSDEPAMIAAAFTGDPPTVRGMLNELLGDSGANVLAVYQGADLDQVAAVADKAHLAAPRVVTSPTFMALVQQVRASGTRAFGHTIVFDALLRLVAVPIRNPLGGSLGVLIYGKRIEPADVSRLHDLVRAEVTVYQDNVVFGSTLSDFSVLPDSLQGGPEPSSPRDFRADGKEYYGLAYPVLGHSGGRPIAQLLLAVPAAAQWETYRALWGSALKFSVLILLLAALFGIWLSRRWLTRPLTVLARAATAIGEGRLEAPLGKARKDEFGDLTRAFDRMIGQLQTSRAEEIVSRQRFLDFAESSSDWLWETNLDGEITYISRDVAATLSMSANELVGYTFRDIFPQDNLEELRNLVQPPAGRAQPFKDVEAWITNREGIRLCLRLNGMPYHEDGVFCGFRGTARDITKVKNDEERLIQLANRDHLTGLANRRRFMEDLAREVAVAERQGHSGAVMLIDLDHFKLVNDTAGHAAGDEVLVQVGGMLRRLARSVDLIGRLSGDEFAIALIDTNIEQANRRATDILKHLSQLRPTYGGKILNTSASIGIVIYPRHGSSPAELLAKADTAMYAAKKAGRNRAHCYSDDDMEQQLVGSQLTWKERIHNALDNDLFELAFQPIAPIQGGAAARYEVLVRLRAGEDILYPPGSFIPTAEQFGLIHEVDTVVVRKAIHALAAQPRHDPPVSFSINLSGLSVGDPQMLALIEHELDQVDIDHQRVVFEITESAACEDINRAMDFIARLRRLGCRVALDDFGVGFSSFSYLKHLKVDIIKIDGSFIRDIANSKEDQLFVKALVDVARGMGMQTVAEFVENADSLRLVRRLGVDYAQGYYVGKPRAEPAPAMLPGVVAGQG